MLLAGVTAWLAIETRRIRRGSDEAMADMRKYASDSAAAATTSAKAAEQSADAAKSLVEVGNRAWVALKQIEPSFARRTACRFGSQLRLRTVGGHRPLNYGSRGGAKLPNRCRILLITRDSIQCQKVRLAPGCRVKFLMMSPIPPRTRQLSLMAARISMYMASPDTKMFSEWNTKRSGPLNTAVRRSNSHHARCTMR